MCSLFEPMILGFNLQVYFQSYMKYIFNISYNFLWKSDYFEIYQSLCVRVRIPLYCLGTIPNRIPSEILIETENCLISTKRHWDCKQAFDSVQCRISSLLWLKIRLFCITIIPVARLVCPGAVSAVPPCNTVRHKLPPKKRSPMGFESGRSNTRIQEQQRCGAFTLSLMVWRVFWITMTVVVCPNVLLSVSVFARRSGERNRTWHPTDRVLCLTPIIRQCAGVQWCNYLPSDFIETIVFFDCGTLTIGSSSLIAGFSLRILRSGCPRTITTTYVPIYRCISMCVSISVSLHKGARFGRRWVGVWSASDIFLWSAGGLWQRRPFSSSSLGYNERPLPERAPHVAQCCKHLWRKDIVFD